VECRRYACFLSARHQYGKSIADRATADHSKLLPACTPGIPLVQVNSASVRLETGPCTRSPLHTPVQGRSPGPASYAQKPRGIDAPRHRSPGRGAPAQSRESLPCPRFLWVGTLAGCHSRPRCARLRLDNRPVTAWFKTVTVTSSGHSYAYAYAIGLSDPGRLSL